MRGYLAALLVSGLLLMAGLAFLPARPSAAADLGANSLGNDFVVRYCVHENSTGDYAYSNDRYLFVYSSGNATYQFNATTEYGTSSTNWTSQLSSKLVSDLYDAMMSEGFMSFKNSYDDFGWLTSHHLERACMELSGQFKTVTFHGLSMIGVAPASYALLNNIARVVTNGLSDIPDAALDIIVDEPLDGGPVATISADFTNNGDSTLSDVGLCNISWPLYIVSVNGTLVADLQRDMIPYCYMEFDSQTTTVFGPWEWNRTGLSPGSYVIMSRVCIWDYVRGSVSADSSWVPDDDLPEPDNGISSLYVGVAGFGVGLIVGISATYLVYVSRKRKQT